MPAVAAGHYDRILPVMILYAKSANSTIKRAASFGLGVCCDLMVSQPSAAKEASIVVIAETLLASVKLTRCCSDDEDSEAAIANAAWSIVKVLTAFPRELAGPVEDSVIAALVARVPFSGDEEEAVKVHRFLVEGVQGGKRLLAPHGDAIRRALKDSECLDDETREMLSKS